MSSSADFVAVIDGDLQHDKSILPKMYEALAKGSGNLAIGTRLERRKPRRQPFPGPPGVERYGGMVLQTNRRGARR